MRSRCLETCISQQVQGLYSAPGGTMATRRLEVVIATTGCSGDGKGVTDDPCARDSHKADFSAKLLDSVPEYLCCICSWFQ